MPSLPPTVSKVLEVANNPRSSASDLDRVISLDPVLSAKVLHLVNSAYFGLIDKISSTHASIVMLGLNTIKSLAISTAVVDTLSKSAKKAGINLTEFWKHCLGVSVTARNLALKMNIKSGFIEDYSLCGLLHDIGKVVIITFYPDDFVKVVKYARQVNKPLIQAEREIWGLDHCFIGRRLGAKWRLPDNFIDCLSMHHSPADCISINKPLVASIYIADTFCKVQKIGFDGDFDIPQIGEINWNAVGLPPTTLAEIKESILQGLNDAAAFLDLTV